LIIAQVNLQGKSGPAPEFPQLTVQMAKGDEDAYRCFYDAYFNRLLGYLLVVTKDEQRAREALQITLLRVARYVKRFDSEAAFWSWLMVLARSSVADENRRTRRYASILSRLFEHSEIESQPHTGETQARLMELLEVNLATLPHEDRELVERKYFEGDSVRQIAQDNQVSEKAVESRLTRTRQKLKDMVMSQLRHEK
jgi:RNA polymerase sigma-70 factor (ECF subfamily)